jgi:hypothetical protein
MRRRSLEELPASAGLIGTRPTAMGRDNLPAWQRERRNILSRACKSFKGRLERGEKRRKAARRVASRYDGHALKSDPARTIKLRPVTLRRIFKAFEAKGESAFELRYQPHRSVFTKKALMGFLDFVIAGNYRSLKSAWDAFSNGKPSLPSYYAARWAFTAARFYEIRQAVKSISAAVEKVSALRANAEKHFTENF